jgi:hypothetical protein
MANVNQSPELDNYQAWQQERYGNIIPTVEATPDGDLYESGLEELDRLAEYMNMQAEQQMFQHERS